MRRHQANVRQEGQEELETVIVRHATCTSEQGYTLYLTQFKQAVKCTVCHPDRLSQKACHVLLFTCSFRCRGSMLHAIQFRKECDPSALE